MNTRHHPDEATIVAYASGTLDEGFAVVVSCHLEVCAECRSRLRTAEALGGAMMCDETETVAVSDGAFGRLLEKMSVERDATSGSGGDKREDGAAPQADWNVKPRALRDYLDGNLLDIKWKRVVPESGKSLFACRKLQSHHCGFSVLRQAKASPNMDTGARKLR